MHTPDPESLRCFVAAAQHLNFRAAASSVSLSAAALGQRIAKLEEQLAVRLFERTTRKVQLTPAGARMLPVVKSLLAEISRLQLVAHDESAAVPYELMVATRFELGLSWLVPNLTRLSNKRPERTLHVSFGDSSDMLARIEHGSVDVSITSARTLPACARFESLHAEEYTLVASAQIVAAPLPTAAELLSHNRLLDLSADLPLFRYFLDAHEDVQAWTSNGAEYLGPIAAVMLRVIEGVGVAVLPRYFATPEIEAGTIVEIPAERPLRTDSFRLVWHEGHPFEQNIRELAADLREIPLA